MTYLRHLEKEGPCRSASKGNVRGKMPYFQEIIRAKLAP